MATSLTLSQQVSNVVNNSDSKAKKEKALIELGLTKYEVCFLLDSAPHATSERMAFTFGVEIECLMRRDALQSEAARTGLPYRYENYNHVDNKTHYKFVSDSSIQGANPIECVSPVLGGKKGMKSLKLCCDTLNAANAMVNRSTGLHVHIGAASLSEEAYCSVFVNYMHLENAIDSFMAESRRASNSRWCKTLQGRCIQDINSRTNMYYALDGDRYFKVNPCSYSRHKTIEFRQHQGSTDFEKISNWVTFCTKLVAWSKKNRLTHDIASIDEIPFLTAKEKTFFKNRAAALNR